MLAADSKNSGGSGVGFIVVALIAIAFVVLIRRTNQRRAGNTRAPQSGAVIGSEVMTSSGMYGTVVGQDDEQVLLEIAPGVQVRFARAAIARVIADDDPSYVSDHPAGSQHDQPEPPRDDVDAEPDTVEPPRRTVDPLRKIVDPPRDSVDPPGDTAP